MFKHQFRPFFAKLFKMPAIMITILPLQKMANFVLCMTPVVGNPLSRDQIF